MGGRGGERFRGVLWEGSMGPADRALPWIEYGRIADMADYTHTIDRWDDATGENLIDQIAAVGDYLVALATYRAAVQRWPKDKITLRNRARVIEKTWRD
jgi:hypothetical protein